MGFKCSFIGHRFEEPGLVNEREERGDEVINIKRRVMVCSICGERRVLAERKEITKQTYDEEQPKERDTTTETDGAVTEETDGPAVETDGAVTEETDGPAVETDGTVTEETDGAVTEETDGPAVETDGTVTEETDGPAVETDGTVTEETDGPAVETDGTVTEETDDADRKRTADSVLGDGVDSEGSGFAGVDVVDSDLAETTGSTPGSQTKDDGMILSEGDTLESVSDWSTGSNGRLEDSWHPATEEHHTQREDQTASNSITAATDDGEILASASTDESTKTGGEPSDRTRSPDETTRDGEQTAGNQQDSSEFGTLSCSACDFSVIAANSPFRSGDICPQCHDAYLTDRAPSCHHSTE